jgi:4-hydroxy-tetrahydrodipicolinate synthase
MTKISGIFAASMSVLNNDLSLNVEKTIMHAEKLIDQGCHGSVIFGSTGQSQLIPISEKIDLLNNLSKSKYQDKHIIGTGLNSLGETINFMRIAISLNLNKFLIMPPAYYSYGDTEVLDFYSRIINSVPDCKIILYNFEKLSGYKFSLKCVETLFNKFPKQIVGVKDSSYNLYENLKLKNFSILPGSEIKLLKGLELGCSGIITATCNVTAELSRQVYDDFFAGKKQLYNDKLCDVRSTFDKYNLISGLHTFCAQNDNMYKNILPPLSLLNKNDEEELMNRLKDLKFYNKPTLAA